MYSAKKNKKKQIFDLYKMDYFAKLCVYFVNMVWQMAQMISLNQTRQMIPVLHKHKKT